MAPSSACACSRPCELPTGLAGSLRNRMLSAQPAMRVDSDPASEGVRARTGRRRRLCRLTTTISRHSISRRCTAPQRYAWQCDTTYNVRPQATIGDFLECVTREPRACNVHQHACKRPPADRRSALPLLAHSRARARNLPHTGDSCSTGVRSAASLYIHTLVVCYISQRSVRCRGRTSRWTTWRR